MRLDRERARPESRVVADVRHCRIRVRRGVRGVEDKGEPASCGFGRRGKRHVHAGLGEHGRRGGEVRRGDLVAREIHHFLMWFFILFAIVHIYLVFYHDYIEQRGETSSIIGGWKFIEEEIADKEEVTENAEVITKSARRNE